MKKLIIESIVNPDYPGYGDKGSLFNEEDRLLWHDTLSACPNPNMFCILDGAKKIFWKPMFTMTNIDSTWCFKCDRVYCPKFPIGNKIDIINPRINCKLYGRIDYGEYELKFIDNHHKFGKCLIINSGKRVRSLQPNSNHNGEFWSNEVFIHKGYSSTWEGSATCITIPPDSSEHFFSFFTEGEKVSLSIFKSKRSK